MIIWWLVREHNSVAWIEMSPQLLDGLPYNLERAFMVQVMIIYHLAQSAYPHIFD